MLNAVTMNDSRFQHLAGAFNSIISMMLASLRARGLRGLLDLPKTILVGLNLRDRVKLGASGKIITALPLDGSTDGAGFNPNTMEAFSSHGNGTLTVIKENSPTSFVVEQTVKTMNGAKTMTIDSKTNRVLTMAAEYAPPPAQPAPPAAPPAGASGGRGRGRGPGRGAIVPDSFTILAIGAK